MLTDRPQRYLDEVQWTKRFGVVEKRQNEDYGKLISLRIWYQNGRELEYGITVTNSPILSSKFCANNYVTTAVFSFTIPHCLPAGILAGDPAGGNDDLVYS